MAIYSAVPPPPEGGTSQGHHQHTASAASTVDIEAWTLSALEALSVSPVARGTGTPLSIPIDAHARHGPVAPGRRVAIDSDHAAAAATPPRRPPSRRDSQKRREAILKGNEGSRQRRRWENDRLMHVPNAQPPLPTDWEVHPTYPVHTVPYHIAQYWDKGLRQRVEEERAAAALRRRRGVVVAAAGGIRPSAPAPDGDEAGHVPRELRATAKRTPAVKSWVRVLEEPVRRFLEETRRGQDGGGDEHGDDGLAGSEDDEVVFAGRRGASTRDGGVKRAHREVRHRQVDSGVVFDALGDDDSGAFKRWLTHSISDYYGLTSRTATVGKPPRRVVYVGIKEAVGSRGAPRLKIALPRPMWEMF